MNIEKQLIAYGEVYRNYCITSNLVFLNMDFAIYCAIEDMRNMVKHGTEENALFIINDETDRYTEEIKKLQK